MLLRDVANLRNCFGRYAAELLDTAYGPEIWNLYRRGLLSTMAPLTGRFTPDASTVDLAAVMREIDDAQREEAARRARMAEAE